ncbi:MAG: hypothetical protein MJB12_17650 [Firmicutes bacterium]|nr:hypothetical protein [Bacillota bacterium]
MSFFDIPPNTFGILAGLLGVAIANNLDLNEQNSLGNFIESVGQIILTVNAQAQLQQDEQEKQKQNQYLQLQIDLLKKQIELLEEQIKN